MMTKFFNATIEGFFHLLSRLPLSVLYVLSDISYVVICHMVKYRRKVIRTNIANSFPTLSAAERLKIEHRFYHFFCDYAVETVKLLTISEGEIKRRMAFEGVEQMQAALDTHPFAFIYLGHYCNWEWISTLPLWISRHDAHCAQLYRPLKNEAFDHLFMHLRTRFGAENISKYDSLKRIMTLKNEGTKTIIGFISDQSPNPRSIHDWVRFLNQDTPVFTGTERIGKKVNAAVFFADVERPRRGRYKCRFRLMSDDVRKVDDYKLTDMYMKWLEEMICRQPHLWLWSHKRWKHRRDKNGTLIC